MKYPKVGEQVRVKNETGLHTVIQKDERYGTTVFLLDNRRLVALSEIVTRHQKWITVYVVQQHFGGQHGWEDVTQEETLSEARERRREYRENTNYPTRIIRRREPNDLYQEE